MKKQEGHYTIKRVDQLPKKGNANLMYLTPDGQTHIWALTGQYEKVKIGYGSTIESTVVTSTSQLANDGDGRGTAYSTEEYVENRLSETIKENIEDNYIDIGGTRIQWGTVVTVNDDGDQVIPLPMPYKNTEYSVAITPMANSGSSFIADLFVVPVRDLGSFIVNRDDNIDGYTGGLMWQTIGKIE